MKKNKIILIITLVLLAIVVFLYVNNSKSTFSDKVKDFAVQDTASVTKIFLADKDNRTILLERDSTGSWLLNHEYKARQSAINLLFETMKNLVPKYPVPEKAHNTIVSLLASQSTKVEVYQRVYRIHLSDKLKFFPHEKLTKTYYVGAASADNMGTFMLMEGSDVPFVVHLLGLRGFVGPRYSTLEKDWRNHQVFKTKLFNIKSVTMELPADPENSFKVESNDDSFKLSRLSSNELVARYDTLKMLNFLTSFADLRYEALLDDVAPERRDSIIHSVPKYIISVTDNAGKTTTIKTFIKPNDNKVFDIEGVLYPYDRDRLYALVNNDRDFVLIQYYVFDKILKPLSWFVSEKEN